MYRKVGRHQVKIGPGVSSDHLMPNSVWCKEPLGDVPLTREIEKIMPLRIYTPPGGNKNGMVDDLGTPDIMLYPVASHSDPES